MRAEGLPADKMAQVTAFRTEVLQGQLVPWTALQGWLDAQATADKALGYTSWCLLVPLRTTHHMRVTEEGQMVVEPPLLLDDTQPLLGAQSLLLHYAGPEDTWIRSKPVPYGGVLLRLQQIVASLAGHFSSDARGGEALATIFVLTGVIIPTPEEQAFWEEHPPRR